MKLKKALSFILAFAVIFGIVFPLSAYAETQSGTPGEKVNISGTARVIKAARLFSAPGTNSEHTYPKGRETKYLDITVAADTVVTFDYTENDGDGDKWYHITSGTEKQGFLYTDFLEVLTSETTYVYSEEFETQLLYFPSEYHNALRRLHAKYPNWKFEPKYVGKTLESCVDMQYSSSDFTKTKKYVSITNTNLSYFDTRAKKDDNSYIQPEPGWTYASRVCIYNFMNPQNLLGEERIFSLLNLSAANETAQGLAAVIKGTFLENGYDKDNDAATDKNAYIDDIMEAAKQSGVSAYAIAALIIVEQGVSGKSPIISGTYRDYEGYYNFFNFGATANDGNKETIYKNGLERAKKEGWSSRRLAIIGGAKLLGNGYIQKGQNSYYLMNFDLANANHQYAMNIQDAVNKAKRVYSAFKGNTDAALTFTIPVYTEFYQKPFPDVEMAKWYTEPIRYVKENGVFSGFADGFFRPDAGISRQDFVVALARCSGEDISVYADEAVNLKDVKKGEYYYTSVAWGYKKGIIMGYTNGKFGVGDMITREQVLTILYRYVRDYIGKNISLPADTSKLTDGYSDYNTTSQYAREAVVWALTSGAVSGKSNGTLIAPKDNCTRAEIAAIFCNCLKNSIITK